MKACEKILSVSPPYLEKVFLLTTGAEATECALKLCRTWGHQIGGMQKNFMISFDNCFHGRTFRGPDDGRIAFCKGMDW